MVWCTPIVLNVRKICVEYAARLKRMANTRDANNVSWIYEIRRVPDVVCAPKTTATDTVPTVIPRILEIGREGSVPIVKVEQGSTNTPEYITLYVRLASINKEFINEKKKITQYFLRSITSSAIGACRFPNRVFSSQHITDSLRVNNFEKCFQSCFNFRINTTIHGAKQ